MEKSVLTPKDILQFMLSDELVDLVEAHTVGMHMPKFNTQYMMLWKMFVGAKKLVKVPSSIGVVTFEEPSDNLIWNDNLLSKVEIYELVMQVNHERFRIAFDEQAKTLLALKTCNIVKFSIDSYVTKVAAQKYQNSELRATFKELNVAVAEHFMDEGSDILQKMESGKGEDNPHWEEVFPFNIQEVLERTELEYITYNTDGVFIKKGDTVYRLVLQRYHTPFVGFNEVGFQVATYVEDIPDSGLYSEAVPFDKKYGELSYFQDGEKIAG